MEDEDKMEEENKKRLDGRWWRKRMEGRWRRGMRRQQEMDKEDRRDRETLMGDRRRQTGGQ